MHVMSLTQLFTLHEWFYITQATVHYFKWKHCGTELANGGAMLPYFPIQQYLHHLRF